MKTLYVKYSNERNEKFRIKTQIISDDGKLAIAKTPESACAEKHVENMLESCGRLKAIYAHNEHICVNECALKGKTAYFEFISGRTLESVLDEYLGKDDYSGLLSEIKRFMDIICDSDELVGFSPCEGFENVFGKVELGEEYKCFGYSNIDMVFSNIIVNERYNIVDYEWCFPFAVPLKYIFFRAVDTYINLQDKRKILYEKDILSFLGFTNHEIEIFREMEHNFQRYAYEGGFSTREIYNNIHGRVTDVNDIKNTELVSKVYFDRGEGFSDKDCYEVLFKPYECNTERIYFGSASVIRKDTGNVPALVIVNSAYSVGENGVSDINFSSNGIAVDKNIFGFTDNDTQLYFFDLRPEDKYIETNITVCPVSSDFVRIFMQSASEKMKLEEEISQTRAELCTVKERCAVLDGEKNDILKDRDKIEKNYSKEIERLKTESAFYRHLYEQIGGSFFWRATKPFRVLTEMCAKPLSVLRKPITLVRCLKEYGFDETVNIFKQRYNISSVSDTVYTQTEKDIDRECRLRVSVIVPNYNHAQYLEKRLDSIYDQTYKNFEVILLDDCSTDSSREILSRYAEQHSENTRFVPNETNSGGVFRQWAKGISLAQGDICWIAESDDFCDNDFLENLVYFFNDEAVMLAYAHYTFWLGDKPSDFAFDHYLGELGAENWKREYIHSAHDEVINALGIKNVIPNTSGCIFRRPVNMPLLRNEKWLGMKICGDWVFYLKQIAGGKIAYNPKANSYFRFHDDSASKVTHTRDVYYEEHRTVAETIAENYSGSKPAIDRNRDIIYKYYYQTMDSPTDEGFEKLYPYSAVEEAFKRYKKTILISIYAFSLGGGEILPIRLANELKKQGRNVSVHIFEKDACDSGVRKMLSGDIPVYYAKTADEFAELLSENHFDILNTHHQSIQHMVGEAYMSHREAFEGCTHIATMHGMYEQLPKEYIMEHLKIIDDCVDIWTRVADKNLTPFYDAGIYNADKHVFIPNGIQLPDVFDADRKQYNIPDSAFVLGLASRALKEKGWLEAVESVKRARELSGKDIHIIMMGSGEMYDELKARGVPDYVHLLGFVKDSCKIYDICDMCFLPSYYPGESFPLTVIEALCVGKPAIASVIGETPRILNDLSGECAGRLFELENGGVPIEKTAGIIAEFASDRELYEKAKKNAEAKSNEFTISAVAKLYMNIYDNGVDIDDENKKK